MVPWRGFFFGKICGTNAARLRTVIYIIRGACVNDVASNAASSNAALNAASASTVSFRCHSAVFVADVDCAAHVPTCSCGAAGANSREFCGCRAMSANGAMNANGANFANANANGAVFRPSWACRC
jgi:hypothetical protein